MQLGPDARTRLNREQANRLPAVAERQHEQTRAAVSPAGWTAHQKRAGTVVDLGFFSSRRHDHRPCFEGSAVELADESFDGLIAAPEAMRIDQILIASHRVPAERQGVLDRFAVGFALARRAWRFGSRRTGVGGHDRRRYGRFCLSFARPADARFPPHPGFALDPPQRPARAHY